MYWSHNRRGTLIRTVHTSAYAPREELEDAPRQMFSGCAALPFAEFGSREELEDALWERKDALRPPLGSEWDRRICSLIEECWRQDSEKRPSLRAVAEKLRALKSSRYVPPSPMMESEDSSTGSLHTISDNEDTLLVEGTERTIRCCTCLTC